MYRDGVGEGQLRDVFDHEIAAFKVALEDLYKNAGQDKGKLCYIVVNKRINTRLMERTPKGFQNPRPGLVVDHMVTRPERYLNVLFWMFCNNWHIQTNLLMWFFWF